MRPGDPVVCGRSGVGAAGRRHLAPRRARQFPGQAPQRTGSAALPLQDPKAAAREPERAVTGPDMRGALVNAHTQGRYLDDPQLRVVRERAEGLDVPLHLHPADGVGTPHVMEGHPELTGPMWSRGTETASHVPRLVFGGVFAGFPEAELLLGHMGEGLPYVLWRLDSRRGFHNHHGVELARENPSEYLRHNLCITTSGVCSAAPLLRALLALGPEHILFGTDHPFEDMATATEFLRTAPVSGANREKIAHLDAERLLRL
ncbi:amidohydrolase family protein [Streptomyces sp. NPDC093094]|uniref:amidohydrolase family protein n=1 Tax=Streptomyces sp. NPDC093094 TaxID=3366026 RepID=UPI0037FE4517